MSTQPKIERWLHQQTPSRCNSQPQGGRRKVILSRKSEIQEAIKNKENSKNIWLNIIKI